MWCENLNLPDGHSVIVCRGGNRPKRCHCGRPSTALCDWKVGTLPRRKKIKTCDVPMCELHTYQPAADKDLCPEHAAVWEAYLARKAKAGTAGTLLPP
jgi:hypothetical protein